MKTTDMVAIITGAGSGIGRASVHKLAEAGMRVAVCGRRLPLLEEVALEIQGNGGQALPIQVDVTEEESVRDMVLQVLDRWGAIDLLLNNAGSFRHVGATWDADPGTWWGDVRVNLFGSFLCVRHVLPSMIERNAGVIINMDGGGGGRPNPGASAYASSKAALLRLNEQLAEELRQIGSGVLVFGMNPGFVHTDMTAALASHPNGPQWQSFVGTLIENGAGHDPGDCGKAILKLLESASPELSGRVFSVDTDFDLVDGKRREITEKELFVLRVTEPKQ